MVGICGVIGEREHDVDPCVEHLVHYGGEQRRTTTADDYQISVVSHPRFASEQPATCADGDVNVWLWGQVYGVDGDEYVSKRTSHPEASDAEYCAALYEEHGLDFVRGLNGEFASVVYDESRNVASFLTDRLGSRPVFYARPDDDRLVFSTNVQSLCEHPAVDVSFDLDYLREYFAISRVYGVKTPIAGVEKLPPSSIVELSAGDPDLSTRSYWYPEHDPVDQPLSYFVERLTEILGDAIAERTPGDGEYGLLLSGGADSRLVLSLMQDHDVTAYHMNDWICEEADVAEEVALRTGTDFEFLKRDRDYVPGLLEQTPSMANFAGCFQDAHAVGFADEIREEVDAVFTGAFADSFFKGSDLPRKFVDIRLANVRLPTVKDISSVEDYVSHRCYRRGPSCWLTGYPAYFDHEKGFDEVLRENVSETAGGEVVSHGIRYDSLRSFIQFGEYYPLTNFEHHFYYDSMLQSFPLQTPFLDTRLIDLHLKLPRKYQLRRNAVAQAVTRTDPELGEVTYTYSDLPLKHSYPVHYLRYLASSVWDLVKEEHLPIDQESPYPPRIQEGPWVEHNGLVREHDFIEETFDEYDDRVGRLDFLDRSGMDECYREHLDGEKLYHDLYTVAHVLNMPLLDQID